MTYDPREVCNLILDQAEQLGRPLDHVGLQKILFFAHAWSLVELGKPLISVDFEAWEHGPVQKTVYREFKKTIGPLHDRAKVLDRRSGDRVVRRANLDELSLDLVHRVVDFYSRIDSWKLVDMTHISGGPWDDVWRGGARINPGMKIDNESIKSYYSNSSNIPDVVKGLAH